MTTIDRPMCDLDFHINNSFTESYGQNIESKFQTVKEHRAQVDHIQTNNSSMTSNPASNTAFVQKFSDTGYNAIPYTGLGKRHLPVADSSNNTVFKKVKDANPGNGFSPSSMATNLPNYLTLCSQEAAQTSWSAPKGRVLGEMPRIKSSNQHSGILDNHYIKSDFSSPQSLPNTPYSGTSPGSLDTLAPISQAADGGGKRRSKRKIEKVPRPNSSIPQDISWEEYARQCSLAAYSSRLNPFALSPIEDGMLRTRIDHRQVTTYLHIRNGILRLWTRNPLVPVSMEEAYGCAKQARYFSLVNVAYELLIRNGYINFGCVELPRIINPTHSNGPKRAKSDYWAETIIVIGAGMSGLACARQLEGYFAQMEEGTEPAYKPRPRIVVLEARRRLGGRVYSHPLRTQAGESLPGNLRNTAELGAHIITGFESGNPLNTIIRGQLGLRYHGLRDNSVLYDCDGSVVDKDRDDTIQKLYNDVLERVCAYRHKTTPTPTLEGDRDLMLTGRDPSDNHNGKNENSSDSSTNADAAKITSHEQMTQRDKSTQHVAGGMEKLAGKAYQVSGTGAKSSATDAVKAMGWVAKGGIPDNRSLDLDSFVSNSPHPTLGSTMDEAIRQYQNIINLTPQDMRLLNWHHANLEYSNAAHVNELSLGGWDQDTGNEFEGEHSQIVGGYAQVPKALHQLPYPLDVRFGTEISSISYEPNEMMYSPATVTCTNGETFEAGHVVLTVPLGVLKEGNIKFSPPLPEWKTGAIERLGFGLLNKVVLVYEEAFWDDDCDMFGLLNQSRVEGSLDPDDYSSGRGRFYLFWNCIKTSGRPVLIALMAGDAAHQTEITENSKLVHEITGRLSQICSPNPVPLPSEVIVTRWKKDPWARGTYSFMGAKSLAGDYDAMAKKVGNLYFAGEATCGTHPATVHGAYLSGLRAAADVVNRWEGPIKLPIPLVPEPRKPLSFASRPKAKTTVGAAPAPVRSASRGVDRVDPEKVILEAIFAQIGKRPPRPMTDGTNPFLLYTQDKWNACKAACDEKRRSRPKSASVKASKDEVRIALGKMWRKASSEEKKPYYVRAGGYKQLANERMAEWRRMTAEWDGEACKIRRQYTDSKPQFGDQGAQLRAHMDAIAAERGGVLE